MYGGEDRCIQSLVGRPQRKRRLKRYRNKWEDNVKKCIIQCDEGGMDWTDLAQDMEKWKTFVMAVMNLWVPKKCREFLDKLKTC